MSGKDINIFFYVSLGNMIKEERLKKKISQEDLAKSIGLSRVSVVNIEKGIQKVQVHTLVRIANILDVNLDSLKLLKTSDKNTVNLEEDYLNRIETSGINNIKNLKKTVLNISALNSKKLP